MSLWSQPNCVGGMAASGLVLEHAQSFVEKYAGISDVGSWGSVVELVDGEEDSRTLMRSEPPLVRNSVMLWPKPCGMQRNGLDMRN